MLSYMDDLTEIRRELWAAGRGEGEQTLARGRRLEATRARPVTFPVSVPAASSWASLRSRVPYSPTTTYRPRLRTTRSNGATTPRQRTASSADSEPQPQLRLAHRLA